MPTDHPKRYFLFFHKKPSDVTILIVCFVISLAISISIQLYLNWERKTYPQPIVSETEYYKATDSVKDWETSTSVSGGYTFRHPSVFSGPATIQDDYVEAYDFAHNLVILIDEIGTPLSPQEWLKTQTKDGYSEKSYDCFHRNQTTNIPSYNNPNTTLLHVDAPILFLDNIDSRESEQWSCYKGEFVRILLVPRVKKIIRVIYTNSPISEKVVSTLKFSSATPQKN